MTRGIRNNNPGNIEKSKDPWQGLAPVQKDERFFTFLTPPDGIRAIARTIITYQDKYGIRTIRGVLERWAPPSENNTEQYVQYVSKVAEATPDCPMDFHRYDDLEPVVRGIIAFENKGYKYPQAVVDAGLVRAGVMPPTKPSRTIRGAQLATVGGGGLSLLDQFRDYLYFIPYLGDWAPYVFATILAVGIGTVVWARIDDSRRGLR